MKRHPALAALIALASLCVAPTEVRAGIDSEQHIGNSGCSTAGNNSADWDTISQCPSNGGTWRRAPYFFGSSSDTCDGSHEGLTYYDTTNHVLWVCNASAWLQIITTPVQVDVTPDSFSFTALTDQSLGVLVNSSTATITGFDGTLTATVSGGGSPQISINGGGWATSGGIQSGQTVQVRLTTSGSVSTLLTATVAIGLTSANWQVTTMSGSLKMFVTYSSFLGSALGGLSGADAECQSEAGALGLAGTYKAILSDATTNAKDRLTLSYPIVRYYDGATLSTTNLWNGALSNPFYVAWYYYYYVWSGTNADGTKSSNTCSSWTSSGNGEIGDTFRNDTHWIDAGGSDDCGAAHPYYCIQQ